MKLVVDDGYHVGWLVSSFRGRQLAATFVVKATYQLKQGAALEPAEEPELLSGDRYQDDDAAKALIYPSDFAPLKPKADVLILGTAHTPGKQPMRALPVRARVGKLTKTLTVIGPRTWQYGLLSRPTPSEPEPYVRMSLGYANAWGGPKTNTNPLGRGAQSDDLPTIEYADRPIRHSSDDIVPAGFGPIAPSWQPRTAKTGSFRGSWQKERWPWLPEDFDYSYFNAAPDDQQVEGYLRGNEELEFQYFHPVHSTYSSRLPGMRMRCFVGDALPNGEPRFRDVPMRLDTLWADLDAEKLILVWRGQADVRTLKLREIEAIFVVAEPLANQPRSAVEYQLQLAERLRAGQEEEAPEPALAPTMDDEFARLDQSFIAFDKEVDAFEASAKSETAKAPSTPAAPTNLSKEVGGDIATLPPGQRAVSQKAVSETDSVEAEMAAMSAELAKDFPPPLTREAVQQRLAARASFAEHNLTGLDLSELDFSGVDLRDASLRQTKLAKAQLRGTNLTEADLTEADLSGADLTGAILTDADLSKAVVAGAKLTGLHVQGATLTDLDLAGADLSECSGRGATFHGSNLAGSRLSGAKLPLADFSGCVMTKADFRGAELTDALFEEVKAAGAQFEQADITGVHAGEHADFSGANFKRVRGNKAIFDTSKLDGSDFSRSDLTGGQFSEASLREAVFDRVQLIAAVFDDADLTRASLTNANLLRASFERVDLTEATLQGSNLYNAGFWEAKLKDTSFRGANLKGTTLADARG